MASYVTPKKNTAFIVYVALVSQADTKLLKSGPTLAAGDFKVSIDGGAFANLGTLPTNTPSGVLVKISLSTSEMNGDNISVACIDAAGAEWCDQLLNIQTSARQIDDLAYPATSGRSMVVDAAGLVDANTVKVGATGAGTAQTAGDLATMITAVDDFVDTEVGAIKTQTDKLTFTVANQVDVNVLDWKSATAPAMTGDAYARLGAPAGASHAVDTAAVKTDTAAIKLKTDNLPSDPADASDIASSFSTVNSTLSTIAGYLDTEIAALVAGLGALTSGERNAIADAIFARSLGTEGYAADGAVPTFAQFCFMVLSGSFEFAISGTTITAKKLDGSTTSMTFTLDDATSPTSRTRAT